MTKKVLSLCLALILSLGLAIPAAAASEPEGAAAISVKNQGTPVYEAADLYQETAGQVGNAQSLKGHYQIASGAPITVSNVGKDASAIFYIYYRSFTFCTKSTTVRNAAGESVDMMGKYLGSSSVHYLTDRAASGAPSAGSGLYWNSSSEINAGFASQNAKTLKPGESVSVALPDDWADTVYILCVEVCYPNQGGEDKYYGTSLPVKIDPVRTAAPTSATVLVNGQVQAFDAYSIGGSNYFKLRDLACVLSGSGKQFEVTWDGNANSIALLSGRAYTKVGGELSAGGKGSQTATPTKSKILQDGREVYFTAYLINGNNYFKLRDIGEAFDFGVDWDDAARTISINTSKTYTPG